MAITINNKFPLRSIIYLKTDVDNLPRQITSIRVYADGSHQYELISGTVVSYHFECEMTTIIKSTTELISDQEEK